MQKRQNDNEGKPNTLSNGISKPRVVRPPSVSPPKGTKPFGRWLITLDQFYSRGKTSGDYTGKRIGIEACDKQGETFAQRYVAEPATGRATGIQGGNIFVPLRSGRR